MSRIFFNLSTDLILWRELDWRLCVMPLLGMMSFGRQTQLSGYRRAAADDSLNGLADKSDVISESREDRSRHSILLMLLPEGSTLLLILAMSFCIPGYYHRVSTLSTKSSNIRPALNNVFYLSILNLITTTYNASIPLTNDEFGRCWSCN